MKRNLFTAVLLAILLGMWPMSVYAATTTGALSPAEVVVIDRDKDGSVISVEGEAVGDALRALGGGRWVNVLGDEVGLGVWMTDEMVGQIEYFGDHQHDGDLIRVTGTLNITCEQHEGEFDLHAQDVEVLEVGQPRVNEPRRELALVGLVGIGVGAGLWFRYRKVRD